MPHYPPHIRNVGEQLISILDSGDTIEFTLAGQDALARKVAAIKGLDQFFEDSDHVSKITVFLTSEYASAESSIEASTIVGFLTAR